VHTGAIAELPFGDVVPAQWTGPVRVAKHDVVVLDAQVPENLAHCRKACV